MSLKHIFSTNFVQFPQWHKYNILSFLQTDTIDNICYTSSVFSNHAILVIKQLNKPKIVYKSLVHKVAYHYMLTFIQTKPNSKLCVANSHKKYRKQESNPCINHNRYFSYVVLLFTYLASLHSTKTNFTLKFPNEISIYKLGLK